jgi:dCTP deaminase
MSFLDQLDNSIGGALPSQLVGQLLDRNIIRTSVPIAENQVQPASIDLRLGDVAWRVRASFLPGTGGTVEDCIDRLGMHRMELGDGAVLERDCVYIVPLLESLDLPKNLRATANPKSSTGRLDVFTRLITDGAVEFDQVADGYSGPLYAEISPRTFSVLVRTGSRLSQLRIRCGQRNWGDELHVSLHRSHKLVDVVLNERDIRNGVPVSVDLEGHSSEGLVGYRAKRHAGLIDVDKVNFYDIEEFWAPMDCHHSHGLILDPGEFYILVSKESVQIPADYAAEMVAYDTLVGEFRVHYAGFFDPGFGVVEAGGGGARAVLEVRSFEVPFLLEHSQRVGRLRYEPMIESPELVYGQDLNSNYQAQGLKLSKHFKS